MGAGWCLSLLMQRRGFAAGSGILGFPVFLDVLPVAEACLDFCAGSS